MADGVVPCGVQGPRNPFHHVRLLEQRVAVGDRLIGEAVAGEVEGDAAGSFREDAYHSAPVVTGGREAVQEEHGLARSALVYEDTLAADLDVAAGSQPAAGGRWGSGRIHTRGVARTRW